MSTQANRVRRRASAAIFKRSICDYVDTYLIEVRELQPSVESHSLRVLQTALRYTNVSPAAPRSLRALSLHRIYSPCLQRQPRRCHPDLGAAYP